MSATTACNFASGPFCQTVARLFEFLLIAPGYQDAHALLEKLPRGLEADAARAARHDCATTFEFPDPSHSPVDAFRRSIEYRSRQQCNKKSGNAMQLGLRDKVAVVTGASRGIGRAVAHTLLEEGSAVAICSRNAAQLDAAVHELSKKGRALGVPTDVTDESAVKKFIDTVHKEFGRVDHSGQQRRYASARHGRKHNARCARAAIARQSFRIFRDDRKLF